RAAPTSWSASALSTCTSRTYGRSSASRARSKPCAAWLRVREGRRGMTDARCAPDAGGDGDGERRGWRRQRRRRERHPISLHRLLFFASFLSIAATAAVIIG